MTRYQEREAKRLGISFQLSCAENAAAQEIAAKARAVRAENIRRTMAATGHSEAMVLAHNITS